MYIAIYARASRDKDDKRISVDRQIARCTKLADERFPGIAIRTFVDNDVTGADPSAKRPGFVAMVDALRRGEIGNLIAHEQSRLTRQPGQWDEMVITLTKAGISKVHTVQGGEVPVDPGNRLLGRLMAVIDAEEVERCRARILAAHNQLAVEGRPTGGRVYGYRRICDESERPALVVDEEQADVIRFIAGRLIGGHSVSSVCGDLNAKGTPTPQGGALWRPTSIKPVVSKPAVAGLRAHHGKIVGLARWKPILTMEEWQSVLRALGSTEVTRSDGSTRRMQRIHRTPRKWLLTGGLARCGLCGAGLRIGAQPLRGGGWDPTYACHTASGPGACRRISISSAPDVEAFVVARVLEVLDDPKMAALLVADDKPERAKLVAALRLADETVRTAAELWGRGDIDREEWDAIRAPARAKADTARVALAALPEGGFEIPAAAVIQSRWEELTHPQRRAVLGRVVESVVVAPSNHNRHLSTTERMAARLQIRWKV